VPHTADLTLEAWGPTRSACLEEAVAGLLDATVSEVDRSAGTELPVQFGPAGDDAELLAEVLDEVLYLLDTAGVVVGADLEDRPDGAVGGWFTVVPPGAVTVVGAVPKAVTRHRLELRDRDGTWWGRVTVDV
jgi:SHS2 domain-containing protein